MAVMSIVPLIERFQPDTLYGFDPLAEAGVSEVNGTRVVLDSRAAWVWDGMVQFATGFNGLNATVMREKNVWGEWNTVTAVPCFDFPRWLAESGLHGVVLKADCEGAEFPILEKMVADGTDSLIALLLVEFHDNYMPGFAARRERLLEGLRCPVELW
jgi:FkbM family methyltransferase